MERLITFSTTLCMYAMKESAVTIELSGSGSVMSKSVRRGKGMGREGIAEGMLRGREGGRRKREGNVEREGEERGNEVSKEGEGVRESLG